LSLLLQHPVRFGDDFELDPRAYELRRAGRALKLERIPLKILCLLVENPGQLVSRDQIIARVWGPKVHVDTDNSINGAMRKLRQVLGDTCDQPRFISTVTGVGYRFIAPVQDPVESARPADDPVAAHSRGKHRISLPSTLALAVGLTLLLCAVGSIAYLSKPQSPAVKAGPTDRTMIAVLPFENLTGDPSQEYFSDGMTEEMITELGALNPQHFGVIARTSVMVYKHNPKPLDQVAKELGVQYVLEGSVRRDADKVRVTAQLIRAQDQSHIWAHKYDRELKDLLVVESEIARGLADEIQTALGNHPLTWISTRQPLSPQEYEAHDLYLKGRYFWNKRTAEGFQQAAEYFQQAIGKDPNYAQAYAGLADTFGLMSTWFLAPQDEFMPKARGAALKALSIDDTLPEAHTSLGLIAEAYNYDWPTAEKEFRRAIQLNPDYATAHQWYAEYLSWQGRFEQALAESECARQLDPLSLIIATDHAAILFRARQYDRVLAESRAVLEMDPNFANARALTFVTLVEQGRFEEALKLQEKNDPPDSPWYWANRAYLYNRSGQTIEARRAQAQLERLFPNLRFRQTWAFVLAFAGTQHQDKAIALLEEGYSKHSFTLAAIKVDPRYDPLRSDPRFQNLLHRLALDR
jgi:TolB-like protein/DNA-binding winged helix-turn-helix (wHTH) protein/Tfp pilus assembly protein PilF